MNIDAQAAVALAAKTKAAPENPATNAQVPGGHFGYGPTQVVAEAIRNRLASYFVAGT